MRNRPNVYIFVIIFILLVDWYSFQAVKAVTRDLSPAARRGWTIAFWSITVLSLTFIAATYFSNPFKWPVAFRTYLFATVFLIYLGKIFLVVFLLIDDILRIFRWAYAQFAPNSETLPDGSKPGISRLKFLNMVGLGVAAFTFLGGVYGMAMNAYNYKIRRLTIKLPNLPDSFVGLKIIQLSDIHSGSFTRTEPLVKAVNWINKENADLIFFTGDLVNNRATEIEPYLDIFGKLKAKEGVFSTFGNHDYGDYDPDFRDDKKIKAENLQTLKQHHATMGWRLLWDENHILQRGEDKVALIGVQNIHIPRNGGNASFKTYGSLAKAYKGAEDAQVKLLLSHDPTHWDGEVNKAFPDIDITFSGHTHGAQVGIEVPGLRWSPAQYIYTQWAGLYQTGKQYLYVNRGFGFIGYPGRVGILPEITVMELQKA